MFWASRICIYYIAYTCRIVVIMRKSRLILQHLSSNTTWSKLIDNNVAFITYSRQSWMINDQKALLELFIFCKEILITSYCFLLNRFYIWNEWTNRKYLFIHYRNLWNIFRFSGFDKIWAHQKNRSSFLFDKFDKRNIISQ